MVWKFCEIWKSYGKRGQEGPKFCEILSHSVRYGMYVSDNDDDDDHLNISDDNNYDDDDD